MYKLPLLHLLWGDGHQLWIEDRGICAQLWLRLLLELLLLLLLEQLLLLLELQLLLWIHGTEQSLHRKRQTYSLDLKSLRNTSLTQLVETLHAKHSMLSTPAMTH